MFEIDINPAYMKVAQGIMGRFCTKVDGAKDPKTYDVMKSFLSSAHKATKGAMVISNTDFGAENVTESLMPFYQTEQQTGVYTSSLLANNKALMLSTKDGAVFCCALVRVGDQDYLSIMNPQTAMEIREAMRSMVEHVKDEDKIKSLEQLTLWDKICDWFAQKFLDRPGEAVSRAEAYRNFYDGMQKHIDLLGRVEQAPTAQQYQFNRKYPEADPNAAQNNEVVQQNNEVVQQSNEVQPKPVEEQPKPVEEQNVGEEQKVNEEPKAPGRRIQKIVVNRNAEAQKENPSVESFYEEIEIDLDALDEEIAREQEEKEKEQQRKYDEALQKRNEELKAKEEKVAGYRKEIKDLQEKIDLWEPKYLKTKARVDDLNGKLRDLDKYDMAHGGKYEKQRLLNARDELEAKIKKIDLKMSRMKESNKDWDRKEAAERNIETTKKAIEQAKLKLQPVADALRYAELDMQYCAEMGQRNGAWMTPEEFLEKQYNQDKAKRDQKYNEEQKARSEKITELENELVEYQKSAKHFSKNLGWFGKTAEQKDQQAVYEKYVKDTKEALSNLQKEEALAKKTYDNEEKAKHKELLSPSKDLLANTAAQLSEVKAKWNAAFSKYKSVGTQFDLVKQNVMDKEEDYQKALNYYKDNFEGKTFKFDSIGYMSLENEKSRLGRDLDVKNHEISMFEANVATFDASKKALLDEITPIEGPNADLQLSLKVWKLNLQQAKDNLAKEEKNEIAPLNMKDPRKKDEPVMGNGMGMGGL